MNHARLPLLADSTLSSEIALVGSIVLFLIILVVLLRTPRTVINSQASLPLEDDRHPARKASKATQGDPHV